MDNNNKNCEFEWVEQMILKNLKSFKIDHIVKLGEGWMSRAYLINHKFVFRFPKEKEGAIDTEKEIKMLPILKKYISLNIPEFIYSGKFIDQISSFPLDQAKGFHIPRNDFYQRYLELFYEVKEKVFPKIDTEMKAFIIFRFESYLENKAHFIYSPKLLHADLSLDHLLFDKKMQELSGIIDFGDMRIGDPDYEYVYLLEECGEPFTTKVMEKRKEEITYFKQEKLSFFLTADNVLLLLESLKRNNRELAEEAIQLIQDEMKNNKFNHHEWS